MRGGMSSFVLWARRGIGVVGLIDAALLLPPLFDRLLEEPGQVSGAWQWVLAGVVLGLSASLLWRGQRAGRAAVGCLAVALLLVNAELAARVWSVHMISPREQYTFKGFGDMDYTGHPLLQYVGTSSAARSPRGGAWGPTAPYAKSAGVLRVACVGGSTTATGYPDHLQRYLDRKTPGAAGRFEVLNFGVSGWTTAHSLVNFMLNVVEYRPDFVVIQHGANDLQVRGPDAELRGDYSHALKPFSEPPPLLRGAMHHSLLLRLVMIHLPLRVTGVNLHDATFKRRHDVGPHGGSYLYRLHRRNISTLVELALRRGITPVLTTQPFRVKRDGTTRDFEVHMRRCNDTVRALARQYGARVLFMDLDRVISGKLEPLFIDSLHLGDEGCDREAAIIGDRILGHHR